MFPTVQPFSNEWLTLFLFFIGIFILLGMTNWLSTKFHWTFKTSRKWIHILMGSVVILCPYFFQSNVPPLTLTGFFIVINFFSIKRGKLEIIHGIERKSWGTVYFPVAVFILIMFWWEKPITFIIAMLLLTYADTFSAIVEERTKSPELYRGWKDEKTVQGSIAMFLISLFLVGFGIVTLLKLMKQPPMDLSIIIPLSLFVAGMATIGEGISKAGSDNLSIPLLTAVSLDLYLSRVEGGDILILLVWILISILLAQGAYQAETLTSNGAMGAFVIGVFVFGIGGWKFMIPLLTFFILSSLLSKLGVKKKEENINVYQKGSKRDFGQVLANGGIPFLLTILWFYFPSEIIYILYISSLAAATADTWGTEIGFFSKSPPRNIINFKPVKKGASGGITILGTFGSFIGAFILSSSAAIFSTDFSFIIFATISGFFASLIDSILGATLQGIFHCRRCQQTTELLIHCESPARHMYGLRWITNDTVNFICTFSGAGLSWFFVGL